MSSSFSVLLLWQNTRHYFGSRFEVKRFRMARKAWRPEGELLGRSESSGNREMNADAQLASPLFHSPGLLPLGWYHPQLRCVFPPPRRETDPEIFLFGDSRFCYVNNISHHAP